MRFWKIYKNFVPRRLEAQISGSLEQPQPPAAQSRYYLRQGETNCLANREYVQGVSKYIKKIEYTLYRVHRYIIKTWNIQRVLCTEIFSKPGMCYRVYRYIQQTQNIYRVYRNIQLTWNVYKVYRNIQQTRNVF